MEDKRQKEVMVTETVTSFEKVKKYEDIYEKEEEDKSLFDRNL